MAWAVGTRDYHMRVLLPLEITWPALFTEVAVGQQQLNICLCHIIQM